MTNTEKKKPADIAASGQGPSRHAGACIDAGTDTGGKDWTEGLSAEHIEACRRAAMLDLQLALLLKARQYGPRDSNEGER